MPCLRSGTHSQTFLRKRYGNKPEGIFIATPRVIYHPPRSPRTLSSFTRNRSGNHCCCCCDEIALAWSDHCDVLAVAATATTFSWPRTPRAYTPTLHHHWHHHLYHLCKLLQRWPWTRSSACRDTCSALIRGTCIAGGLDLSHHACVPFLHLLSLFFSY